MSYALCNPKPFISDLAALTDKEQILQRCNQEIEYIYGCVGVELDSDGIYQGDKKIAEKCKNQFTKYVRLIKENFPTLTVQPTLIGKDVKGNPVHIAVEFLKMNPTIMKVYHGGQFELKQGKKAALNTMNVSKLLEKTDYFLTQSSNPSHWLLGLALATGRRFNELFSISELSQFSDDAHPFMLGSDVGDRKWSEFVNDGEFVDCIGFEKLASHDDQTHIRLPLFFSSDKVLNCFKRLRDYTNSLPSNLENLSYHSHKISTVAKKEFLAECLNWESSENFTTHKLRSVYGVLIGELLNAYLIDCGQSPMDSSIARQYAIRDRSNQADHYIAWYLSEADKKAIWEQYASL